MTDFNTQVIHEFRENGGHVSIAGFGDGLVLVHSIGARSGEPRISPLVALPDGDGWLIAASKAGAPEHPAWFHNLTAHPETTIEVPADGAVETVDVLATTLTGADRDEAWSRFTSAMSGFAEYEEKAGDRVIPVVRLSRR